MKIIIDTHETKPWDFTFFDCETVNQKLPTGDYTVAGLEEDIMIERKASTSELALNFGKDSKRFYNELERAKPFKYKYLVCEFPEHYIDIFPQKSGIPPKMRRGLRMNAGFLRKCIENVYTKYGVVVVFCNTREDAQSYVYDLLSEILENNDN